MKILVVTKNPLKRFLVELHSDKLVKQIASLVGRKRYHEAATTTLARGRLEKEVSDNEFKDVKTDIILTSDG